MWPRARGRARGRPRRRAMAMALALLLLLLLRAWMASAGGGATAARAPLVGILTQPWDANHTYMAASYAKLVESAGGRPVPIHHEVRAAS
eukprot:COSAG01_NODE_41347_length_452_cov_3.252269_1_plen_89_part_01